MVSSLFRAAAWAWLLGGSIALAAGKKPNVLFILTDDQDWHMESLQHMPLLQKYLMNEGTLYSNHFCTIAVCCPSRVNLWTGKAGHNTNVTDLFPPYGGYPKIVEEGIHKNHLQVWMQDAGYNTYYTGKLYNAHNVDNYNDPPISGFNGSDFILDPYTYEYFNARMTRNAAPPISYAGQYSPDVVFEKAQGFLHEALLHPDPWFLTVAPIAPHSNCRMVPDNDGCHFPRYADRHAHLFKDYKIPRDSSFNPDKQGGVGWIKKLPKLNDTVIEYNDEWQRSRLRALQSVDEGIESLIRTLEAKGELDNTYIFYTTDNGYHLSQHRMVAGKECGYDTDIHIPLIVRGPGIAAGRVTKAVTSHTDLAPTILHIAEGSTAGLDGTPIPLDADEAAKPSKSEHVNIEFWGWAIPEGHYGMYAEEPDPNAGPPGQHGLYYRSARNNTYKGLRLVSEDYSLYYSVWCTGDKEYYDLKRDPGQILNYFDADNVQDASAYTLFNRKFEDLTPRLDALMMVLKSCKEESCHLPWSSLHPKGDVTTLKDAMSEDFDSFYQEQPKVSFSRCELGYLKDAEGPQEANVFGEDYSGLNVQGPEYKGSFRYTGRWSDWT